MVDDLCRAQGKGVPHAYVSGDRDGRGQGWAVFYRGGRYAHYATGTIHAILEAR